MLYHGSPNLIEEGEILLSGKESGYTSNSLRGEYIYATSDTGFSMTTVEEDFGCSNAWELAVKEASLWAGSDGWVYAIDGEILGYDDHFDVSPCCVRLKEGARIIKRFSAQGIDVKKVSEWGRTYVAK